MKIFGQVECSGLHGAYKLVTDGNLGIDARIALIHDHIVGSEVLGYKLIEAGVIELQP